MFFADKLTLDAPRKTSDGYMVVRAKAARTGVYQYTGSEVDPKNEHGLRDQALVNVLRDEETVFDKKTVHSFIGKPVTIDHPREAVTADNWKDHASGVIMGALRDGEYQAFDLLITDKAAIEAVDSGKRELSNGYAADLAFGDFKAVDGTVCQARQVSIRGNHVALVDRGRAGPECRIADAARCTSLPADVFELLTDERTYSDGAEPHKTAPDNPTLHDGDLKMPHTLMIDGFQVPNVSDEAKAAIEKLQGQVKDEKARADTAEGQVATLTTDKGKLEGEKVGLEKQLKDATDPATLQAAAASRAALINKAISVSPNIVTDGKSDAEIRKEVVNAQFGDDAKDFDDAKIEGAFLSLTRAAPGADPVRDALRTGVRTNTNDSGASVRDLARATQF
jgi:hypothetical protein